jgi:hypothetical protein
MIPMIRIAFILAVGSTLLFAEVDRKAAAGDGTTAAARGEIMPQKAYLVFTKESWGCLEGQAIVADVTQDLTATEGKPVLLTEVKNPEDVDNRLELYLYYPAQEISRLPGYYVLRLGVTGPEAQIPGTLRLAKAALVHSGQGVSFLLKAKTTGHLKSDLLYAGDTRLVSGLFTCAEADLFEAHPARFLGVYPVHTEIASTVTKIDPQWDRVAIQLEEFRLKEGEAIATCYGLLTAMEKKFSASNEHLFLWDQSQLTPQGLNLLASSLEQGRNYRFHVNIELRAPQGNTEIQRDSIPLVPQLRQMIAARNAQGKITGGSVMIAVEKPDPK